MAAELARASVGVVPLTFLTAKVLTPEKRVLGPGSTITPFKKPFT